MTSWLLEITSPLCGLCKRARLSLLYFEKTKQKQHTFFGWGSLARCLFGSDFTVRETAAKNTRLRCERAGQLSVQVFVGAVWLRLARPHAGPGEIFQTLIPEHPVKSRKQVGGGMRMGGIGRRQQDGGRTRGRRKVLRRRQYLMVSAVVTTGDVSSAPPPQRNNTATE